MEDDERDLKDIVDEALNDPVLGPILVAMKTEYDRPKFSTITREGKERLDFVLKKIDEIWGGDAPYDIKISREGFFQDGLCVEVDMDVFSVSEKLDAFVEVLECVDCFYVSPIINDKVRVSFNLEKVYKEHIKKRKPRISSTTL